MDEVNDQPHDREQPTRLLLARALTRARGSLLWERLWPALAALATVVGLFLAFSWAGLWLVLPPLARAIGLFVFLIAIVAAALPLLILRLPSVYDGLRRLDRSTGETHRPATTVADRIAANSQDPVAQALWQGACRARVAVGAQVQGRLAGTATVAARSDGISRAGGHSRGGEFLCRWRRAIKTRCCRVRLAWRGCAGEFPYRCLGHSAGLYWAASGDALGPAPGRNARRPLRRWRCQWAVNW